MDSSLWGLNQWNQPFSGENAHIFRMFRVKIWIGNGIQRVLNYSTWVEKNWLSQPQPRLYQQGLGGPGVIVIAPLVFESHSCEPASSAHWFINSLDNSVLCIPSLSYFNQNVGSCWLMLAPNKAVMSAMLRVFQRPGSAPEDWRPMGFHFGIFIETIHLRALADPVRTSTGIQPVIDPHFGNLGYIG